MHSQVREKSHKRHFGGCDNYLAHNFFLYYTNTKYVLIIDTFGRVNI